MAAPVALALVVAGCSDGRSVEAFCERADALAEADDLLGDIRVSDPPVQVAALERVAGHFDRVADAAPDDIRDDAEQLAAFVHALAAAVDEADPTDPFDQAAELSKAQAEAGDIDGPSERFSRYVARHCAPAPVGG